MYAALMAALCTCRHAMRCTHTDMHMTWPGAEIISASHKAFCESDANLSAMCEDEVCLSRLGDHLHGAVLSHAVLLDFPLVLFARNAHNGYCRWLGWPENGHCME